MRHLALEVIRDEHQALAAMLRSLSMLLQHARRVAPMLLQQHPDAARRHVQRWLGAGAAFMRA